MEKKGEQKWGNTRLERVNKFAFKQEHLAPRRGGDTQNQAVIHFESLRLGVSAQDC